MDDVAHVELLSLLRNVEGMVILSGYDCELYRDMLTDWQIMYRETTDMTNKKRVEALWVSPNAMK